MLQIKKKAQLINVKYNAQFLFRLKKYNEEYFLKKQKNESITLRSPKNFNIGKNKIVNLNYRSVSLNNTKCYKFPLGLFVKKNSVLFSRLLKFIQSNTYLGLRSVKLTIKTTFKIMWLEI